MSSQGMGWAFWRKQRLSWTCNSSHKQAVLKLFPVSIRGGVKTAQNPGPSVGGEGKVRGHETPFRGPSCADGQQVKDGGDI